MFGRAGGITAICIVAVHALLLPPDTDNSDLVNPLVNPKSRSIQLPCPSCVYPLSRTELEDEVENNDQVWTQPANYEVNLSFGVSSDGERLELNGEAIYPPEFHAEVYLEGGSFYADLVSASGRVTPLEITSSGVKIESEQIVSTDGDSIVLLKFRIMTLEQHGIEAFPDIAIDLLKMKNGELFIVTVDSFPDPLRFPIPIPISTPSTLSAPTNDCGMLPDSICQLKNKILQSIEAVRYGKVVPSASCSYRPAWSGRLPTHIRPHIGFTGNDDDTYNPQDQLHQTSSYYYQRSRRHRYIHAFARGVIAILIPITAGITVGLFVSFLGLVVGRTIGCIWINLVRGGRRGYASVALGETAADEEKILIVAEKLEPLPAYEDAPSYDEIA